MSFFYKRLEPENRMLFGVVFHKEIESVMKSHLPGIVLAGALIVLPNIAAAQPTPEAMVSAAREAMQPLSMLEGTWTGTGTFTLGPGQSSEASVVETAEFRLSDTVLVIEGIGRAGGDQGQVVHNALGIISWDAAEQRYRFRAYRLGGQYVDADFELDGNAINWSFEDPRAGMIEYHIEIEPGVSWTESGRISRDGGANWYPFFEMHLRPGNMDE